MKYKNIIPYIHISGQLKTKEMPNNTQNPMPGVVAKFVQPVHAFRIAAFNPKETLESDSRMPTSPQRADSPYAVRTAFSIMPQNIQYGTHSVSTMLGKIRLGDRFKASFMADCYRESVLRFEPSYHVYV